MTNLVYEKIADYYNISVDDLNNITKFNEKISISNNEDYLKVCLKIAELSNKNKRVLIVGDYDADGITSTSILIRLFRHLDIKANYYIPKRIDDGYGLNCDLVKRAKDNNFDLLVTVDNGVKALDAIKLAKELNQELMIIDHHEYEKRPDVNYFLHSDILEDNFKHFSAAGLALIVARYFYEDDYDVILAAIGLIGDLMSIDDEIRTIVRIAHQIMMDNLPFSIEKLLNNNYNFDSIAYEIVPKLNALSRVGIGNVNNLVKYLIDEDKDEIINLAKDIDYINNMRKQLTNDYYKKVNLMSFDDLSIIVIYDNEFKEGICGLLANKLAQEYHKPVLVFGSNDDLIKGSGRSYGNFDLYQYLNDLNIFKAFGGHAKAVGLTLDKKDLDNLVNYIKDNPIIVKEEKINLINVDADEIDDELVYFLNKLRPFGKDFNEPIFKINHPDIKSKYMIKNLYPKWVLNNGIEAISFNKIKISTDIQSFIGCLKFNSYQNRNNITITVKDII